MTDGLPTRCAPPTIRGISTYTVLGFTGYGVASIACSILAWLWDLPILDRAIVEGSHTVTFKWPDGVKRDETVNVAKGAVAYVMGRRE